MAAPLAGVRVLDVTRMMPGNYCTWLLSSLGADVIKVEEPVTGDPMRSFGVQVDGQGATHHLVNRGKRSIAIDLKDEAGREAFLRLADTADVVVESFRPGVMDRLGLGPDVLRARRPSLVVGSISGFGADGPHATLAAHDINGLAFSGHLDRLPRGTSGVPSVPTVPIADLVGGSLLPALGLVALVFRARATGEGGWLDAALADGAALLPTVELADHLAGAALRPGGSAEFGGRPFYRVYELADGFAAVGAVEPHFWRALCDALGLDEYADAQHDEARRAETAAALAARFRGLTKSALREVLVGRNTCTTIVNSYADLLGDPHAHARDLVRDVPGLPMRLLAPPFRIDRARPAETVGAPRHGEHTHEVLAEVGWSGPVPSGGCTTGATTGIGASDA